MKKILLILSLLIWFGCDTSNGGNSEAEAVYGCTDPDAINYNSEATVDDESCEYPDAHIVVSIALDSGDCNSCNIGSPRTKQGVMAGCASCLKIVIDYSVQNIGTGTANNTKIRFQVEYAPLTNIQLGQKLWHSDIIDLYSLSPDEIASGSIVALDYEYWNGTNPVTYNSVKVYLDYLGFSN
jgi:hypothetical protein